MEDFFIKKNKIDYNPFHSIRQTCMNSICNQMDTEKVWGKDYLS